MDIIILGFLMIQPATIYDLGRYIENYLSSISSNSKGSIQAGIKKLLDKELITFNEVVENGLNKKVYCINEAGITYFNESISIPMMYKEKNMELSKFFFMGFVDRTEQIELIDKYIGELEKELSSLQKINSSLSPRYHFDKNKLMNDADSENLVKSMSKDVMDSVAQFQYATLDLSIDKIVFEIEWFKKFKASLIAEGKS